MVDSAPDPRHSPVAAHPRLRHAAERICSDHAERLPDLSAVVVLMPQLRPAMRLHESLMAEGQKHGHSALLLPRVQTLRDYLAGHAPVERTRPVLGDAERLLMLVNALREHRGLFGRGSPWLLAENLLQLFDELSAHRITLPETSAAFARALAGAYGLPADHPPLLREAELVQTLWQAWQRQLAAEQRVDATLDYIERLGVSLQRLPRKTPLYALGFHHCLPAEEQWLDSAAGQNRLIWLDADSAAASAPLPGNGLLGRVGTETPYSAFLDACYDHEGGVLHERIAGFRQQYPDSPALGRLHILGVDQLEQHAQAVALYVRAALAEGEPRIGIVSEDRRLARRIRALLERSGIALHDTVGWALSTTAAAALLENWLECIEEDFPHRAFLDLLKSPFHATPGDTETLKQIYRFEHDIVIHEQVGSGMDRYRHAVNSRAGRLQWGNALRQTLLDLVGRFEEAARPLRRNLDSVADGARRLRQVIESLRELAIYSPLVGDAAGEQLIDVMRQLAEAAERQPIELNWSEFRGWLSRALEQTYFLPPQPERRAVQLLNLQQTDLLTFDVVIVAAADEQHLPGDPGRLPFFNDAVRHSLGLPDWRIRLRERERLFRELIESGAETLITWQKERAGEPVAASPWVSALDDFHRHAYGRPLQPVALQQWLNQHELVPVIGDDTVPVAPAERPAPSAPTDGVPEKLTVSAHQRLIDCPYRFYVYDVLQLKALDEVREALQKSDYGNRVHECLEAFHFGRKKRSGPFNEPLTADNRDRAVQLLETIAREVFAEDTDNNFQHRGWLQRWLRFIPDYIDWQIAREPQWHPTAGEQKTEARIDDRLTLYGRIDRVDSADDRHSLIDYKTGYIPAPADTQSGEDVQLTSYSLLLQHVQSVLYVGVDGRQGVNDRTRLEGEELATLRGAVSERLKDLMHRIRGGAPMPAIGDEATCRHCDAAGICRRKAWRPF